MISCSKKSPRKIKLETTLIESLTTQSSQTPKSKKLDNLIATILIHPLSPTQHPFRKIPHLQLSNSKSLAICNETAYQSLLRSRKRRFITNYRKQKRKKSTKINDLHSININITVSLSNEVSIIVSFFSHDDFLKILKIKIIPLK